MGTPAFPNLGKHCQVSECNLVDFLPFTCDRCEKVFCLEHRTYASHECPKGNVEDVTVLICPMCAKSVRLVYNEDPNITWERHVQTSCDPSDYVKATKKQRCPVPRCKEVLTLTNKIRCKDCGRELCLKHRFGPDHQCEGRRQADRKSSFLSLLGSQSGFGQKASQKSGSQAVVSGWTNTLSSIKSSAEAGLSKLSLTTNEFITAVKGSASRMREQYTPPSIPEICPQCRERFHTIGELIQHVESVHSQSRFVEQRR